MKSKIVKQVFDFLPGRWKIARSVASQVLCENIKADGDAAFIVSKDNPNLILYSEKVTIYNSALNTSLIAMQKYKYKHDIATSSISKYFNDGKFFYKLNISDHKIGGEHLCIQDKYTSNYVFGDGQFTITYSVEGPSKCYEIITEYTKIDCKLGV